LKKHCKTISPDSGSQYLQNIICLGFITFVAN
jgi:hypothetical protein